MSAAIRSHPPVASVSCRNGRGLTRQGESARAVQCPVESFNTIAAKDAHAHGGGYRSGQALNALTFHRERGEIGRHRVNLAPVQAEAA